MSTSANSATLKNLLKFVVKLAQDTSENAVRIPVAIHGNHGIGKTEIIKSIAKELGYNPVILNLSTQDISDLVGIPYRDTSSPKGVTRFASPDWFGDAIADERPALFFLDEMNRAEPYVLQTMLPFCLEGRIHTHHIRPNDVVICAMNPDNSDYSVTAISDKALLSRFQHIYFEPSVTDWLNYNREQKVHHAVIQTVEQSANILGQVAVADKDKIRAVPDRRKFTMIGKALNLITHEEFKNFGFEFLSGMVGADAASIISTQYRTETALSSADIYCGDIYVKSGKGKTKTEKLRFDPKSDMDKVTVLLDQIADDIATGKVMNIDTLAVPETYTNLANRTVTMDIANIHKFILDLPVDTQVGYIKRVKQRMTDLNLNRNSILAVLSKIHTNDFILAVHKTSNQFVNEQKK